MSTRILFPAPVGAALLAGCATHRTHVPAIYQQEATPAPVALMTESGQRVVYESPITETERTAWVRENIVPQSYAPPVQRVEVVRVIEQPVYYERPYRYVSPVHLNLGYHWGSRGHHGWHTGLGWSFPLYW